MGSKFTEEYVKEFIESNGDYSIISLNYINQKSKISIRHNICNSEFLMDFDHWKNRAQRCPLCAKEKQKRTNIDFINKLDSVQPGKYTLLGEYINKRTKIKVKCRICGHEFEALPCNILKGQCMGCMKINNNLRFKKSVDDINKLLPEGYSVIGEYINNKTPTEILHSCGKTFRSSVTNLRLKKKAQRCPYCYSTRSYKEEDISSFIRQNIESNDIFLNYKIHDSENKHKFKELDIYTNNIGIEFNGLYWHSTDRKPKHNLLEKTEFFKNYNIPVIHIFEDEWDTDQDIIKDRLSKIIANKTQFIIDPANPDNMIEFTDNADLDTITIDRRWFVNDSQIITKGYELFEVLPPREFYLTNTADKRFSEKQDSTNNSIFDCGYLVYKKK